MAHHPVLQRDTHLDLLGIAVHASAFDILALSSRDGVSPLACMPNQACASPPPAYGIHTSVRKESTLEPTFPTEEVIIGCPTTEGKRRLIQAWTLGRQPSCSAVVAGALVMLCRERDMGWS